MKWNKTLSCLLFCCLIATIAAAQGKLPTFTRADSLLGSNVSPMRTCYKINYYHLDVRVDVDAQALSGSNQFVFTATRNFKHLQFDLYANLNIAQVLYKGRPVKYSRELGAVFLNFADTIKQGSRDTFTVFYSGKPTIAKKAPWEGGMVFATDSTKKPWVGVACESAGASIWWPCKDQRADEPDSMLISIGVPNGLKDVSNGRLRSVIDQKNGYTQYNWFVNSPINHYDVTLNIADYTHITDTYTGEAGLLTLDYWVLPNDKDKAANQFARNVKPMLKAFEHWFGPYPFYADGYKLVETPYLGMEHQSAIAYGNKFLNGYLGHDRSATGWGLKWDYIVIHESAHEWFGNNITGKDAADMWIHESFADYAEAIYVEAQSGKLAGQQYVHGLRGGIENDEPIIGAYNVNHEGSADMYNKGSNLLNMIRVATNNDDVWQQILRGLNKTFYHQTVTTADVITYINKKTGINFTPVFNQYLRYNTIPVLEFCVKNKVLLCRWVANAEGFALPVKVRLKGGDYKFISPTTSFTKVDLPGANKDNIEVDTFNYYIGVLVD